jgi:hypothetical protein
VRANNVRSPIAVTFSLLPARYLEKDENYENILELNETNFESAQIKIQMKMHLLIRRFAGGFILASLLLGYYQSRYWLWITAFVGVNLFQSSFTHFCPLEIFLRKMGAGDEPGTGKTGGSCCVK